LPGQMARERGGEREGCVDTEGRNADAATRMIELIWRLNASRSEIHDSRPSRSPFDDYMHEISIVV